MRARLVVADAGPLHYLVLIDCAEILASLFDHVLVPFAVRDELIHPRTPKKVKDWILQPRPWLEITPVVQIQPVRGLHKGETEALQLAIERKAAAILMDDMDGRAAARRLGLSTIFTLAVLELAAETGLTDLPVAVAKLRQTSFFIANEILEAAPGKGHQAPGERPFLEATAGNNSMYFGLLVNQWTVQPPDVAGSEKRSG